MRRSGRPLLLEVGTRATNDQRPRRPPARVLRQLIYRLQGCVDATLAFESCILQWKAA